MLAMFLGAAGFLFVVAEFLMGVQAAEIAARPPYKRPLFFQRAAGRITWSLGRLALLLAGLLLCAAVSRLLAVLLILALATATLRRATVRSRRFRKRMLRAAFVDLCKQDPHASREELLAFLIQSRHPRWDPEMIGQMVQDHPTVDGLLDSLLTLERQVLE